MEGCSLVAVESRQLAAPMAEVFPEDADELLAQDWHLFDCRSAEEYEEEHIPGALHIPLDTLVDRLSEIDSGKRYVVYCRSGVRSLRASSLLLSRGVESVSMKGGIQAWGGALSTDEDEQESPEYSNGNGLPYRPSHHQESLTGQFMN